MLNLALLQMEPHSGELQYNRAQARRLVEEAMGQTPRPDLLVLPETWTSTYSPARDLLKQCHMAEESLDGESIQMLREYAKRYQVWICGGTITLGKGNGKSCNSSVLINRKGEIMDVYDKIHLCGWVDENVPFAHGEHISVIETELGRIGTVICYDLRFPELTTKMATRGMELLLVPSCFSTVLEHWKILLKARAVENQVFVAACNCCGSEDGYTHVGHSMVIDPVGKVIAEASESVGILTAQIDLEQVASTRRSVTYVNDRRPEIYADRQ